MTQHTASGANPTTEFFEGLALRKSASMPRTATTSMRFELTQDRQSEYWRVGIDQGGVRVSRDDAEADCVLRADRTLFDGIVSGRMNAMTALLRGALLLDGDPEALVLIQRLFPGPAAGRES